jgi:hydroxyacylglutathione hydrolase
MRTAIRKPLAVLTAALLYACAGAPSEFTASGARVLTFTHSYTNAYLVTGAGGSFLIDAGLEADGPKLAEKITAAGVDPQTLRGVIVTHGHYDHAGAASYLKRTFGTPVIVGAGDGELVRTGTNDTLCAQGFLANRRLKSDQAGTYTGVEPDVLVTGRADLAPLVGVPGEIVVLPGHTSGSLVVTLDGAAFVGDLVRGGVISNANATRHFYMCDLVDNDADMRTLLDEIAPDTDMFLPGHFGPLSRKSIEKLIAG